MNVHTDYKNSYISDYLIGNFMENVFNYLAKRYGTRQADADTSPLYWYLGTGRACHEFRARLIEKKPYMIGRKLAEGGSYDEAIDRVSEFIGFERIK